MHPILTIGVRAARKAGDYIVRNLDRISDLNIDEKSLNDYVSEVDRNAEQIIIETIHNSYPDHAILAEESGQQGESEYQWIIDPLDGTTNFLHGFPQFAVSIAVKHKEVIEQAIIYDPLRQELFTATRGDGAQLNNRKIRVSNRKELKGALLGTGFPFGSNPDLEIFLNTFRAIFPVTSGIRRAGAASLDLAFVACGRLDGFWEFGLKEWDIAAGTLLIQEAGGMVSRIEHTEATQDRENILCANPKIYSEMKKIIDSIISDNSIDT
ncbi:MAG: inositol monophosphatase [Gammaproteobacteria bacterium]|nr:inositol monophosphatase [Gammaproteobacteria bacterium]